MADKPDRRPQIPTPFVKGAPIRATEFEQLRQAVAFALQSMIGGGPGIIVSRRGDRYLISAERQSQQTTKSPWFLTGQIESGPVLKIYVKPGMVNNFVPTIGGTLLVAVPAPGLTVTGASGVIQLKATVDSAGTITALIAENVAGPAVTADTLTIKYKLVGTWTASGGVFTSVNSILNTNQTLRLCVGNAEWY